MIQRATPPLSELYETDETAWLDEMACLIRDGHLDALDYAHLQEYLTDVANRDRREVRNRLTTLLMHVLKWTYQPERRTGSWRSTIMEQTDQLADEASQGVLRNHAEAILPEVYKKAVKRAAVEIGLPIEKSPGECPYTLQQLLATDLTAPEGEAERAD